MITLAWRMSIRLSALIFLVLAFTLPVSSLKDGRPAIASSGSTIFMKGQSQYGNFGTWHEPNPTGPSQGLPSVNVFVAQSGSGSSAQTQLGYDIYRIDVDANGYFNWVDLESGWGTIPNSAVHFAGGANPNTMRLNIDTSTLNGPNFWRYGAGGLISVSVTGTSLSSFSNSGTQRGTFGSSGHGFSFTSSGSSWNGSADAQGTVISQPIPDPTAAGNGAGLGSWQGVQLCRNCAPSAP